MAKPGPTGPEAPSGDGGAGGHTGVVRRRADVWILAPGLYSRTWGGDLGGAISSSGLTQSAQALTVLGVQSPKWALASGLWKSPAPDFVLISNLKGTLRAPRKAGWGERPPFLT